MATETLYLNRSISGNATDPGNALGPQDNVWAGSLFGPWRHLWGFPNPQQDMLAAGQQKITVFMSYGGTKSTRFRIYRGRELLLDHSLPVSGQSAYVLEWSDPGGSSHDIQLDVEVTSPVQIGDGVLIDAATWTALLQDDAPPSPWSVWEGGVEVPVTMSVFEGGVEVPVT